MKLIGVTLFALWLGICLGSENRYSENPYNGQRENGLRQSGNERTNGGGAPVIGGIPSFVYDVGLRQEGNELRRQQNGFSQDVSMQGINGQTVDPNSVIDDKNILTQRFQYQEVSNRNEVKESPMTHFQIPGMKQYSQVSSFPSQRNGGQTNILPSQQFAQQVREFPQTSTITRFQEAGVRQPISETRFHPSEMRHSSGSSYFSSTSQQFDGKKSELQTSPSFPPSFESTFETSKIKESSQSVKYEPQNQEKIHASRQSEEQTRLSQNVPSSVFPSKPSEERKDQGSSEFPSQIRNGALDLTRQPQQFTAQEEDSRITSDFQPSTTFQIPGPRQPFETIPEISRTQPQRFESMQEIKTKNLSQFPQTIDSQTRTQTSETRQPLKSTLQDKNHRNQISESQRFAATGTDDRHRFPVEPSLTQFQESGIRQSIEPARMHSAHEDTQQTHDKHRQTQQFATQETGVKSQPRFPPVFTPSNFQAQPKPSLSIAPREDVKKTQETEIQKPQFSPSLVPQVPSPHGQISPSQQFVSQETEVKAQPGFPTEGQRFQLQPLPHQETVAKARPQFPPSPLTKSPDTRQYSQVEEKETESQTFQSKEADVRAQTRFQSAPSIFPETRQPSVAPIQREEAVVTTHDQRFPTQQITSIESEKKTSTGFSFPQISHFQAAGAQQQEKSYQPIVRQESLAFPPRFNLNLFRDVGYASPPVHNRPNVALVRSHNIGPTDEGAYAFIFESEDGIIREEQGGFTQPDKGITAKTGSFSYIAPDGTIVETSYIADERGYRTQSAPLARIHDPDLPAGKYDRYRSALAEKQRNDRKDFIAKDDQEARRRF